MEQSCWWWGGGGGMEVWARHWTCLRHVHQIWEEVSVRLLLPWKKRCTEKWPLLKSPFITSDKHSYLLFVMMPLVQMCLQWELPGPHPSSWTSRQHLALWVSSQGCGHRHWSILDLSTCTTCQHDEQLPAYNIFLCIWMVLNQTLSKLQK